MIELVFSLLLSLNSNFKIASSDVVPVTSKAPRGCPTSSYGMPCRIVKSHKGSIVRIEKKYPQKIGDKVFIRKKTGTGFFFYQNYLVTNYHVVGSSPSVSITLESGLRLKADVIGTDTSRDIAVLKVRELPINIPPLSIAEGTMFVGEPVVVIGYPLGFNHFTAVVGIINSLRSDEIRLFRKELLGNYLITDAAINSGNSGSPVLRSDGSVAGMVTAMHPRANSVGLVLDRDSLLSGIQQIFQHADEEVTFFTSN